MSLTQSKNSTRRSKFHDFWRATHFLKPYRALVAISVTCALLVGGISTIGLGAVLPILKVLVEGKTVREWVEVTVIEKYAARPGGVPWYAEIARGAAAWVPDDPMWAIGTLFGMIALLAIIANVVRFFQEHLSDRAAILAVNDIRRRMYDDLLHMPLAFYAKSGTSDVTSRLISDAAGLQDGIRVLLGQTIQAPINATMALGLALWINWPLTLIIIGCAPLMFAVIKKLGTKVRRAMRSALQQSAAMLSQLESTLQGIRVVKSAGAERLERRRYRSIMEKLTGEQLRMSRYEAITTPAMETMALIVVGVILMIASYLMFRRKTLDPSSFMMIMICLVSIAEPLRRLSKLNNVLQRSNAAAARLFEIFDLPVERTSGRPPRVQAIQAQNHQPFSVASGLGATEQRVQQRTVILPPVMRDVVFDHVTFRYPNTDSPAVNDVSLRVPKGTSVAVVGRNGSGKTTLLALLPRFYTPDAGQVLVDGTDLRSVTLRSLRRQISVVTQESIIFPGTIAENIAYGHPLAARLSEKGKAIELLRQRVEEAARRAFAHEFIIEKPQGYDTSLDGLGGQLSGGQRQRINIARAILRDSPILILDEATSQVDAESEHLIQQAIESLMKDRTTFVIAHRFSTILSADTIVVMERGRIVGQGRHEELLQTCPTYQQLYERQLVGAG